MTKTPRILIAAAMVAAIACGEESEAPEGVALSREVAEYADMEEAAAEEAPSSYPLAPVENEAVDTAEDRLATFSLDVDTASYTLMRRSVLGGSLPAPESVRIEELINYFDYADAPPTDGETPFAVHLESAPHPFLDGTRLMRVGVRAREVAAAERPATNLVFLVDVSGSMTAEGKIDLVQYALGTLVDGLRPQDHVGIVVYAGSDAVVLQPTEVERRGVILDAIQSLGTGGSTNGAAGIRTAYDLAARNLAEGGINRVILCTDGDFNVGATGEALMQLIRQERERGITLTVLGFGRSGINDHQMEQLADQGNGSYAFIDSEREALRVLSRDLQGTLQIVAGDVKVQVAFDPELVTSYRLVGYENRALADEDFANDAVDAAEIGSGDFVTAFLEYQLADGVPSGANVAEVRLRYKDVGQTESTQRTYPMNRAQEVERFDSASRSFRFGAAVAELGTILRRGERSHPERIERVIAIASEATDGSEEQAELVQLAQRIATQL